MDFFEPKILYVGKGVSLFSLIDELCEHMPRPPATHRLFSLARKMNVNTAVIEKLPETYSDVFLECQSLKSKNCDLLSIYRITFLTDVIELLAELVDNKSFIASAYIINFRRKKTEIAAELTRSYIYRAIVALPKVVDHPDLGLIPVANTYLHIFKSFACKVGISKDGKEHEYDISGTYFCQQNSITSVCAHAALCVILNNLDEKKFGLVISDEVTSKKINDILIGDGLLNENSVGSGLSINQVERVLDHYDLNFVDYDFVLDEYQDERMEYNDWIYNYLESKHPVLLVFNARACAHVVAVLGHTLNTDLWRPDAEKLYSSRSRNDYYQPASAWVDNLIIHDDNFGMYLHLSVDALKRLTLPKHDPSFRATYGLALLPKDVKTPPKQEAERACMLVTSHLIDKEINENQDRIDIWTWRLISHVMIDDRSWVIRTLLSTRNSYMKSLEKKDYAGNAFSEEDKQVIAENLPYRFWLSEISLPDLYTANKTKLIDFFYPCDLEFSDNALDMFQRWIQVRFPDRLIRRIDPDQPIDLSVGSHFPLLRFESETVTSSEDISKGGAKTRLSDQHTNDSGPKSQMVLAALDNPKFKWRTVDGISQETGLTPDEIQEVLTERIPGQIVKSSVLSEDERELFTTRVRFQNEARVFDKILAALKNRAT